MNGATSPSAAVESAKKVCTRLHQAYRDHRLYPAGHPSTRNTLETLTNTVTSFLNGHGSLALEVTEDRLLLGSEEVYSVADTRDNLAFLMFRDGIRTLTVNPGIEVSEIEDLVDCVSRADQLRETDHDLSTALWEKDLVHISLEVVDPFLESEGARDEAYEELRETVLRRLSELGSVDTAEAEVKGGDTSDGDSETRGQGLTKEEHGKIDQERMALTEEEIERGDWLASHPSDPLDEFVVVLIEIISGPTGLPGGEDAVIDSLSSVIGHYLDAHNLDGLAFVMEQMDLLEVDGRLPRGSGLGVFGLAATAERLDALIAAAVAKSPEEVQRVEKFLALVQTAAYPAFLEALAVSNDRAVRKTILDVLQMGGGVPTRHIWPLMEDARWYVVRNAVQLATATGDPEVLSRIKPLVRHPDARVRREAIRSVTALGGAKDADQYVRALQDEDSGVRTLAARGLISHGTPGQFPALQAHVEAKELDARPSGEVEALLFAYAVLGGGKAVETLNRVWKRRVFGTRPMPVRLAAVMALGAVSTEEADAALTEAAGCGDAQIERAAARARSEAQRRVQGVQK